MVELDLETCWSTLTWDDFLQAENILGVVFPSSFKSLIKKCDACRFIEGDIIFFDNHLQHINGSGIGAFLSFKKDYPYYNETIIGKFESQDEFFPRDLIAFAVDGAGNYFCFDYREGKDNPDPPIVFWNHEGAGTPDAISPLAPNFEAFLGMLKSEEEAEKEYEELRAKYQKDG